MSKTKNSFMEGIHMDNKIQIFENKKNKNSVE